MPDIKEKPKMGKPKAKNKADLLPKQAARMTKEKYIRDLKQRPEQTGGEDGYAAGQVEDAGRWAVDTLADAATPRRPSQQQAKKNGSGSANSKDQTATGHPPGQYAAPAGDRRAPERTVNPPKERRLVEQAAPRRSSGGTGQRAAGRTSAPGKRHGAPEGQIGRGYVPQPSEQAGSSFDPVSPPLKILAPDAHDPPRPALPSSRPPGRNTAKAQPPSVAENRRPARLGRGKPCIKERPRTALSPRTRASTGAGPKTGLVAPRTNRAVAKQAVKKVRQQAQRQVAQHMAAQAAKAAKQTVDTARRAAVAVVKAVAATIGAIAGIAGGAVLVVALVIVIVIAAIASSPFGLFFAQEQNGSNTVTVAQAVATINADFNARLESLRAGAYDSITVEGRPPAWADVLAVFAAQTAGAEIGIDVATLDAARVAKLTTVFWDMTTLAAVPEASEHPASGDAPAWTEMKLTITAKTADDMRTVYAFTAYQNSALDELLANRALLDDLAGGLSYP